MFTYQLQRSRRSQRIKLSITPRGEVVVSAPADCPVSIIENFVRAQHTWIEKHMTEVRAHIKTITEHENHVVIFGKTYHKTTGDMRGHIGVTITDTTITITPVSATTTSIEKTLTQFLKSTATKYILPRTAQLAQMMQIKYITISLKNQKTRWGSCSSRGNLNFNWRLVHCPPPVIDYVIIHELAHRREMNHSSHFWQVVAQFDPEYQKHRGWLKRQGMQLG